MIGDLTIDECIKKYIKNTNLFSSEFCPLYVPFVDVVTRGVCRAEDIRVDTKIDCKPESCYKLKSRGINIHRLKW